MAKQVNQKNEDENPKADVKISDDVLEPHKKPIVFLFDFEEDVKQKLKELRFNCFTGSFGSTIKVENQKHEEKLLKLNLCYPTNLHEFDILILDLTGNKSEDFDPDQHQLDNTSGHTAHALLSAYPEQIFDPRPLFINYASRDISELHEKKSIIIVFCGAEYKTEYQFVEITATSTHITNRKTCSNFGFYNHFPDCKNRSGRKANLPDEEFKLSPLFLKYLDKINYHTIFYHPTIWNNNEGQKVDNFIPLLRAIAPKSGCHGASKPNFFWQDLLMFMRQIAVLKRIWMCVTLLACPILGLELVVPNQPHYKAIPSRENHYP